ncbi:probable aspartic proteinase GIP1 [Lotus japonicus]|uniref:probable aspartic proteinase GIP1 n=1 Tax=Lotus japonicus TaxID=34305 RepID=UPI0025901E57|nr:probable aspartic proteinase GIP1 [Lotus japonicus]
MPFPLSPHSLCFIFSLFLSLHLTFQTTIIAPISKDNSTQFYTLTLHLKTPPQPTKLHLHLGSSLTWLLCNPTTYNSSSSSYHPLPCNSSLCSSFHSSACTHNTCALFPENPITRTTVLATALLDSLTLPTSTQTLLAHISDFLFSCSTAQLLQGLATNAAGLAALGRSNHSLPAQISSAFSSPNIFALCLPGSSSQTGTAFFGSTGPYFSSSSKIDLSKSLNYTPLVTNPVGDTVVTDNSQPSDEYFINVTSIRINGVQLPINQSILTVDQNGYGGTKISTSNPYTVLESSIYKAFVELFVNQSSTAFKLTVTEAVAPFGACYHAEDLTETRVGPAVPTVDLVMDGEDVFWRLFGSNSMVRIESGGGVVWCLGFVDGGTRRRTGVVIGGHQMEDNLVQFDVEANRFGFSSSLLLQGATCAFG